MTDAANGLAPGALVGVIGAGAMGAGIAQVAAAAGHAVRLFDVAPGAADAGCKRIASGLAGLVAKGRMAADVADALTGRIAVAQTLEDFADCALVVEVVVENLDVKRDLIAKLEAIVAPDAILASNTSSLSITSIARNAAHPERVAGMHFFNPAPVMKLVEVVSGAVTSPDVAACIFATATAWGKVAVHAKSTPGFIVNRVARPYYAEALRLFEEQVATPATIDALLTQGAGFRMGPFDLMDLIGHDVNYAVTRSVFDAYYQDPRYRPSLAQLELVNAGRLGRKSGHGFFDYGAGAVKTEPVREPVDPSVAAAEGVGPGTGKIGAVQVLTTDGRTAAEMAWATGAPVILCDLLANGESQRRLGFAASPDVDAAAIATFVASLAAQDIVVTRLADWPALVTMRTVAMLANEAFEAVMQGVGDEAGVDAAMRFGVNYPRGPIGWAREIGVSHILCVIDHLHRWTGDPRYRASMGLRMAAEVG